MYQFWCKSVWLSAHIPELIEISLTFKVDSEIRITDSGDAGGSLMAYLMGEAKLSPNRVDFDRRLKLEFHGSDISTCIAPMAGAR